MAKWLIVFKAHSAARFPRPADGFTVNAPAGDGIDQFSFRTRFTDEGLQEQVPRELLVIARGEADDYETAEMRLGTYASGLVNLVSFATNASIGPIELYVGVDETPGLSERRFLQKYGPLEGGFVSQGRAIPIHETGQLLSLVVGEIMAPLTVGAHHYTLALNRWESGGEVFVLGHLYTAAEAIEKTIAMQEAAKLGVPLDELHMTLRIPKNAVGAYYRRTVIFAGHEDLLKDVKSASDGLEHGSLSVAEVQERARTLAPPVFVLIRQCLLERLGAPEDLRRELLSDRYKHPLDPSLRRIIEGAILSAPETVNAEGYDYPFLTWESSLSDLAFDETDTLRAAVTENMRVHIPDGAMFKTIGYRIYGRPKNPDAPAPPIQIDATVTVNPHPDEPSEQSAPQNRANHLTERQD
jgi:hypothetical protein